MTPGYIFLLVSVFILQACSGQPTRIIESKKDTSFIQSTNFSELLVDSIKLENFITKQNLTVTAAKRLRSFYISRNYQFAWFTKDGLAEQTEAFLNLHNSYTQLSNDSMQMDKNFHHKMEILAEEENAIYSANDEITTTELELTEHFFMYAQYAYAGKVDPEELQWHIRRKKVNVSSLLDSLIANKGENSARWEPINKQYRLMNVELKHYSDITKRGGWKDIVLKKKKVVYRLGDTSIVIKQLKQRLMADDQFTANDTSETFSAQLQQAIMQTQKRYGFKQDGMITTAFITELNVPVKDRIEQLLVNMERMRWMPEEPTGNRIIANIPDFKLHVFEEAKKVFEMDIVVGTAANKTVVFKDMLRYIVFSPY